MRIYEKVKDYIKKNHLKQTSIAKSIGMKDSTLSAILNGKRNMYADEFKDICNAFGVSSTIFTEDKTA